MAKIEIQGVQKSFGASGVLKGVDVAIAEGEFFTLVGPSGCGKSTLLNLIAGLDQPSGGRLLFDGQDVTALAPRERDVAMVFQSYALYPHLRVRRNLAFPLEVRKLPRADIEARVARVSKMLGLEALLERYPKELSGGQQQRVALGRALIRDPRVFLMDEPLSNLDAKLRTQMRLELKRLHREVPVTTVYVTHDQEEAMSLSDRLAILKDGVLQQCGTPQQVYDKPANLFVAQFIGKPPMNVFEGKLEEGGLRVGRSLLKLDIQRLASLKHSVDGHVLIGIRPEHLEASSSSPHQARVDVVEMLGSETWVELDWEGTPLVLKTLDRTTIPGKKVGLVFPAGSLHFFDPNTKERLE